MLDDFSEKNSKSNEMVVAHTLVQDLEFFRRTFSALVECVLEMELFPLDIGK